MMLHLLALEDLSVSHILSHILVSPRSGVEPEVLVF